MQCSPLLAGLRAVDEFSRRVGVPGMVRGLFDEVEQDPAEVDGICQPEEDVDRWPASFPTCLLYTSDAADE